MNNMSIMKKAHELTRKIKAQYSDIDYQAQFGLCLSYLYKVDKEVSRVNAEDYKEHKAKYELARALNNFEEHEEYEEANTVIINTLKRELESEYVCFDTDAKEINSMIECSEEDKNHLYTRYLEMILSHLGSEVDKEEYDLIIATIRTHRKRVREMKRARRTA